jgi:hypothetical protein
MKQLVLLSINTTSTDVANAQVAITDGEKWAIIAPFKHVSGLSRFAAMPNVSCPVVNVCGVNNDLYAGIVRRHTGPEGVNNIDQLLQEMEAVGAQVSYPVSL